MNLPNKISVFRILLIPIMAIIPLFNIQGEILNIPITLFIIDIIFIIGALSDKLDGYIARKTNQITDFGKLIDSIADKILVIAAMIILVEFGKIPSWIVIVVAMREFIVMMYKSQKTMGANMWGRIKAVIQMVAVALVFVDPNNFGDVFFGKLTGFEFYFNGIVTGTMIVAIIATLASGWNYLKGSKDVFKG